MRYNVLIMFVSLMLCVQQSVAQGVDDVHVGNEAFRAGRVQDAVEAFTRAITSGALEADALAITYNNRGVALSELGELDNAISDYLKARDLVPDDTTTQRNLRVAYLRRGMRHFEADAVAAARADYDLAVEIEPDHPAAYVKRAELRAEAGELAAALRDYEAARARDPKNLALIETVEKLRLAITSPRSPADDTPTVAAEAPQRTQPVTQAPTAQIALETRATTPSDTTRAQAGRASGEADTSEGGARRRPQVEERSAAVERAPEEPVAPEASADPAPSDTRTQPLEPAAGPALEPSEGVPYRAVAAVNFRAGPGNDAERVGSVDADARVLVFGERLGWKKVLLANGQEGWIYKKWLEPLEE